MAVDYKPLPERLRDTMRLWIEKGIPPGSGTKLILCHDLAAVCACDDETVAELPAIYRWMYNNAPAGCHGSKQVVEAWGKWRRNAVLTSTNR
jgi:hypothetical protein